MDGRRPSAASDVHDLQVSYEQSLLDYFDRLGLSVLNELRGWSHMGAVLADAALQRRADYKAVVLPRVRRLVEPGSTVEVALFGMS